MTTTVPLTTISREMGVNHDLVIDAVRKLRIIVVPPAFGPVSNEDAKRIRSHVMSNLTRDAFVR